MEVNEFSFVHSETLLQDRWSINTEINPSSFWCTASSRKQCHVENISALRLQQGFLKRMDLKLICVRHTRKKQHNKPVTIKSGLELMGFRGLSFLSRWHPWRQSSVWVKAGDLDQHLSCPISWNGEGPWRWQRCYLQVPETKKATSVSLTHKHRSFVSSLTRLTGKHCQWLVFVMKTGLSWIRGTHCGSTAADYRQIQLEDVCFSVNTHTQKTNRQMCYLLLVQNTHTLVFNFHR